eukprot:SAG11_NODE_10747_length_808_cov_0.889986_1_plen_73_part_00
MIPAVAGSGLGYGQEQIGTNLLLMAQYDKPQGIRRVLLPMVPINLRRMATYLAMLATIVLVLVISAISVRNL